MDTAATPVKRSRDEASKLLGEKMLQGWTMLGNSCPVDDCYTPLMRSKQGKMFCVRCDQYVVTEEEAKKQQEDEEAAAMAEAEAQLEEERKARIEQQFRLEEQAKRAKEMQELEIAKASRAPVVAPAPVTKRKIEKAEFNGPADDAEVNALRRQTLAALYKSMGYLTTYLRAVESAREDRIINDPFAEPLTREQRSKIEHLMSAMGSKLNSRPEDFIAFRTRYVDEALDNRDPRILQVVILGAGLDARAYRLDSLRGCHVMEVDQSSQLFDHKSGVMEALDAPLMAEQLDCIVFNLAEPGLEETLIDRGFDRSLPSFWVMEGLLSCMERPKSVDLMKIIDSLSAPGSELWADFPGRDVADPAEWGKRHMKYGEDDSICGVVSEIPWTAEVQASTSEAGTHFGRDWLPK
ncbi:hypothetical protein PHYBOEH_005931 [Phytophthora boehmeriae]|uniref:S-adenosyl-L-methionine-dependent methyltransferase n=1 Tax=Phytophthora boehmeriae TaxID=109152 RepID=A0A8T1WNS0_9STRA|nr:hypothetical protein PHYBOEH_005931 [Phytophthora boehmeriae]